GGIGSGAPLRRRQRLPPERRRRRPGREDREPVLGSARRYRLPQASQLRPRAGEVAVWRRRDLDLRLQELAHHVAVGRLIGGRKEFLRHATGDELRLRVDQKILFFNSESEVVRHPSPRMLPSAMPTPGSCAFKNCLGKRLKFCRRALINTAERSSFQEKL